MKSAISLQCEDLSLALRRLFAINSGRLYEGLFPRPQKRWFCCDITRGDLPSTARGIHNDIDVKMHLSAKFCEATADHVEVFLMTSVHLIAVVSWRHLA